MKVPHTTIACNNNGYFTDIFFVTPFWAYTTVMFAKNTGLKYRGVNPILLKMLCVVTQNLKPRFCAWRRILRHAFFNLRENSERRLNIKI